MERPSTQRMEIDKSRPESFASVSEQAAQQEKKRLAATTSIRDVDATKKAKVVSSCMQHKSNKVHAGANNVSDGARG
jgi:hypothetical protein